MKKQMNLIKEFVKMLLIVALLTLIGKESKAQVLPEYSAFPETSVGLQLGTQGFGIQGTKSFARFFNVRVGFNTTADLSFQYNNRTTQLDRTSVYAIIDWQPLYGRTDWFASKWFVSTGVSYYFTNSLYRQGIDQVPNYYIYMSKFRPYIGTGLGNISISDHIGLRTDFGWFIPTSAATSTYENKADKVSTGIRGLLPGLNAGATIYIKF
ncbi:hypothetical protein JN11_01381 [Mucilaginibacter frigoritolerans]|uniref:Outer membrane protein with beta-barrel domain n=2 Tax=Mucilaginibacter frigoritolerans TaxID=652788 RepID=A0A562U9Z9_9SPHI|nr:hypothetical protein JN11_01381 [Mucilaginibacter frigoritolerans]